MALPGTGRMSGGSGVNYETVAEAYGDLEEATGRLALIDRLATLLARTPDKLLPTVCYLCQGLIAAEVAGIDLGLAEKLAIRAVAIATGNPPEQVAATVRETGDLGQAAEQLLAATAADRAASLVVTEVVDTLHQVAQAEGPGSQGRKLELFTGLLARAVVRDRIDHTLASTGAPDGISIRAHSADASPRSGGTPAEPGRSASPGGAARGATVPGTGQALAG
jgi:hypothetical protein